MERTTLLNRIVSKCKITPSGCWEWTGRKGRGGYGRISVRGKERAVHRVMLMLAGVPIFDEDLVDHLCRNRACCNPQHLEPVTPAENTRRGNAGRGVGVVDHVVDEVVS